MARKQAESECMFCFSVPCTCIAAQKKPPSVRKKLTPAVQEIVPEQIKLEAPRSGILGLGMKAEQEKKDDLDSESEALTALFRVFDLEIVDDPGGFESIRPKLKMSPVDINILRWKRRRARWLRSRTT